MDPRRKKIYIILIVICFILSAGILVWTNFFSGGTSSPDSLHSQIGDPNPDSANTSASGSGDIFPASSKFQTSVLNSDAYKQLKSYTPVNTTGQLGRPDPFNSY